MFPAVSSAREGVFSASHVDRRRSYTRGRLAELNVVLSVDLAGTRPALGPPALDARDRLAGGQKAWPDHQSHLDVRFIVFRVELSLICVSRQTRLELFPVEIKGIVLSCCDFPYAL